MSIIDAGPLDEKETGESGLRKIGFGMKILHVVHSPKHLRSSKGKVRSISELEKFIVQRNLKFRRIKDGGNCKYETDKSKLIVRTHVTQVDKTSKFDQNGMPAYIVRIESEILTSPKPEKKKEKLKPEVSVSSPK